MEQIELRFEKQTTLLEEFIKETVKCVVKERDEIFFSHVNTKLVELELKRLTSFVSQLSDIEMSVRELLERVDNIGSECDEISGMRDEIKYLKQKIHRAVSCDIRVNGIPYSQCENPADMFDSICNNLMIQTPP